MRECPSVDDFLDRAKRLHYKVFSESFGGPYNLNIVGWRNIEGSPDKFDDWLAVYFEDSRLWFQRSWKITTRPGIPWLLNPANPDGAAILLPGQYRNAYRLGDFKGSLALKQVGPVKVYRDNTRDAKFDAGRIEEGLFGLHIHRGGVWMKFVGNSSAGCQVFQNSEDYLSFIDLVKSAAKVWGSTFTYTLMEF